MIQRSQSRGVRGFFVTGTDTGVGKTLVACALLHALAARGERVVGMKPVAAGAEGGRWEDVEALLAAGNVAARREWVNPYRFEPAIAPHLAAQREGVRIEIPVMVSAFEKLRAGADRVVVEGAGGIRVPLNEGEDMGDLARDLGLPVILVVALRLGCLNHAILTAEAVRDLGLRLGGWVANEMDTAMLEREANVMTLEARLGCPLFGRLPWLGSPDPAAAAHFLRLDALLEG